MISEVEREFARNLDEREDIKLSVKLPSWFEVDTPVGKYNPDWAVVKQNSQAMYRVRETKGTKDFLRVPSDLWAQALNIVATPQSDKSGRTPSNAGRSMIHSALLIVKVVPPGGVM